MRISQNILPVALRLLSTVQRRSLSSNGAGAIEPAFILGSGRNGSTLIAAMINQGDEVIVVPEQFFLYWAYVRFTLFSFLSWPRLVKCIFDGADAPGKTIAWQLTFMDEHHAVADWPKERQTLADLLSHMYRRYAITVGKPEAIIVDKTPINTTYLNHIKRVFPSTRYAFLNRDGRAVVASYAKAKINGRDKLHDIEKGAQRWYDCNASWAQLKLEKSANQVYELSYEQLVTEPEVTLRDLMNFLGGSYTEAMLDFSTSAVNLGVNKMAHHSNLDKQLNAKSLEQWRAYFSPEDLLTIETIMKPYLIEWGYLGDA